MSAFREAFAAHDAKDSAVTLVDGERIIEGRQSRQRRGDETALKRDLSIDLVALMNTINLDSIDPLGNRDYVRKSVVNYGLPDVAHMTSEEKRVDSIRNELARALVAFEPRINRGSIVVDKQVERNDTDQRVRFAVSAEMFCTPVDVAVDFVAELEIASGKVNLTRLPVSV